MANEITARFDELLQEFSITKTAKIVPILKKYTILDITLQNHEEVHFGKIFTSLNLLYYIQKYILYGDFKYGGQINCH